MSNCACMCVCAHMWIAAITKPLLNKTRDKEKQMSLVLLVTALEVIDGICPT